MGRGGKRVGAGRKPKTLEQLQISGSFRPSRHSHLLKVVPPRSVVANVAVPATEEADQPAPAAVLVGLGVAGQRFVTAAWREFEAWGVAELELLRQAARTLDDAETSNDPRVRQGAARLFASLIAQLGLQEKN